ncbi:MAG: hypothetical protein CUN55_11485 [Phototrophicales bacterium]|nr:MAG: hypothetical protein CUN55_11485 [Phototrophicales bacterium]
MVVFVAIASTVNALNVSYDSPSGLQTILGELGSVPPVGSIPTLMRLLNERSDLRPFSSVQEY